MSAMIPIGRFFFRFRNALFPVFFFALALPWPPIETHSGSRWLYWATGLTLILLGQLIRALTIGLVYIVRGGRRGRIYAKGLVSEGIYAHCRNPMYLGNMLIVLGFAFVADTWPFYLIGVPLFLLIYLSITKAEESYLLKEFDDAYRAYMRNVPRFLPRLKGLTSTIQSMHFRWKKLVSSEYGTTFGWIAGVIFLTMKNVVITQGLSSGLPRLQGLSMAFIAFFSLYLTARYLKKTDRLNG
jgi:protein-S-isoprenylcysteine O-methyltransferase Ste14